MEICQSSRHQNFMAYLIIMGLEWISGIDYYWPICNLLFSKHLSLINACHAIIFKTFCGTLHLLKHTQKKDLLLVLDMNPLCKVQNVISMAQDNLKYVYIPSKEFSLYASSCPFKGWINLNATILTNQTGLNYLSLNYLSFHSILPFYPGQDSPVDRAVDHHVTGPGFNTCLLTHPGWGAQPSIPLSVG